MNMPPTTQPQDRTHPLRRTRGKVEAAGEPAMCPLGRNLDTGRRSDLSEASLPLAQDLRQKTAALHERVEVLLGLPDSIADRTDYVAWLGHYLALYQPLESRMAAFDGWTDLGRFDPDPGHSRRLIRDLDAFGLDARTLDRARAAGCPALTSFAQALGARYVLEGSALGGKVILRHLRARLGDEIGAATAFFGGPSHAEATHWRTFKAALDRFGMEHPHERADVLAGATATFTALIEWFTPFMAERRA
ncbi:heme oxygenase [Cereibacter ovatus]|uniref:Heme oxygenase n=1 Tax=Cereibacter ovatus TaxID=439529 RepID=A0A285CVD5_9RHOB|nr:biliverdin-producing heme oxygenase [Cereibacter ovatus]SNX71559.1 heme oxygenase [Cereibacter ovatus]